MKGASRAKTASSVRWRVRHYDDVLPNGLRVLAVPRKSASRATATMLFRVGSRYETSESNGISHFLEHMLYRGSPSLKTSHDQALAFEELGTATSGNLATSTARYRGASP